MDEDSQSWQDRCDRYFTSISDSGNSQQKGHNGNSKLNGHIKNTRKEDLSGSNKDGVNRFENDKSAWKHLSDVQKHKKGHPVFRYIRNAIFKIDIHGTKFAGESNNFIEMIVWGIIILAIFSFTIFLTVLQYKGYQKNKTYFRTQTFSSGEKLQSFPVLSICNVNILKNQSLTGSRFEYLINESVPFDAGLNSTDKNILKLVLESNTKLSKLVNSLTDRMSDNLVSLLEQDMVISEIMRDSNDSLMSRLRKTGLTTWFDDIVSLEKSDVIEYGHVLHDVIIGCFIGTSECKEGSLGVKHDERLGNCFTVTPDVNQPVQLLLNAESDEYIVGSTSAVGFKIILHQNSSDVIYGRTIHVGVNSFTTINIQEMKVITRQEGDCREGSSSQKQCLRSCYKTGARDYCECGQDSNATVPMCRKSTIDNIVCRKIIKLLIDKNHLGCNCQENCRETIFKTEHSAMSWPSSRELPIIARLLQEKKNVSFTETQIRNNLVKVEINLRPESIVFIEEIKEYEILDILARFGGLFAFAAGMSVLTLIELLWTVVKSVFDTILYINGRSAGAEEKERLSDSDITSVTWAMYKQKRRQEELAKQQTANNERPDKRRQTGNGLSGNVNSRLHRRNSYLSPISEHDNLYGGEEPQHSKQHRSNASDRNSVELSNDYHQLYELKSNKYRVMNPNNVKRYVDTHGHTQQNYVEHNGSHHNGVSVISPPYSSSVSSTGNRNPVSFQNSNGWRYGKGDDRVHYGYTSAFFHTNVSEPTFL